LPVYVHVDNSGVDFFLRTQRTPRGKKCTRLKDLWDFLGIYGIFFGIFSKSVRDFFE